MYLQTNSSNRNYFLEYDGGEGGGGGVGGGGRAAISIPIALRLNKEMNKQMAQGNKHQGQAYNLPELSKGNFYTVLKRKWSGHMKHKLYFLNWLVSLFSFTGFRFGSLCWVYQSFHDPL